MDGAAVTAIKIDGVEQELDLDVAGDETDTENKDTEKENTEQEDTAADADADAAKTTK